MIQLHTDVADVSQVGTDVLHVMRNEANLEQEDERNCEPRRQAWPQ